MKKHMDPYEREKSLQKLDEAKAARGDDGALSARFEEESSAALREAHKKDFVYKNGTKMHGKSLDLSWGGSAKAKKKSWLAIPIAIVMAALMLFVTITNKDLITSGDIHNFLDMIRPTTPLTSGTCGDNLTWSLSADGVLTIGGTGSMDIYEEPEDAPWANATYFAPADVNEDATYTTALRHIVTVRIEKGVEFVSIDAFAGLPNLRQFRIEPGNESYATKDGILYDAAMTTLLVYPSARPETDFSLPSSVVRVADRAFTDANNLKNIQLHGALAALPKDLFGTCSSLENISFGGTQAEWEALGGTLSGLGENVTLEVKAPEEEEDTPIEGGLSAELMYEFFAGAYLEGSSGATLLDDMSTVHIAREGYIEFTVYAEKAGIYGLAMKENHVGARVDYLKLLNLSIAGADAYPYGTRLMETETVDTSKLTIDAYGVSASTIVAPYTQYYIHTYLKAGENRVRLMIKGSASSSSLADMGIYSFRLDLVEADTPDTVMVYTTEANPNVVVDFGSSAVNPLPNFLATGLFFRSGGKVSFTVNVPSDGTYMLSGFFNTSGGNFAMYEEMGSTRKSVIAVNIGSTSGGSNAIPYTPVGEVALKAGIHTYTIDVGVSHMNFGAIRFVKKTDAVIPPLTEMPSTAPTVLEGEINLFDKLTVTGASKYENGVISLNAGLDNAILATVTVDKPGVYLIRLAGKNAAGSFYLNNMSVAEDVGFTKLYKDNSCGYATLSDGFSAYGFYQYLQKGENELRIYSSSSAKLTGVKMKEVLSAPNYIMISKNAEISSEKGFVDPVHGYSALLGGDKLTYTATVAEAGNYRLSLIGNGDKISITVYDTLGNTVGTATTVGFTEMVSGDGAMSYLDTGIELALSVGTYKIEVSVVEPATTDRARKTYLGEMFLTDSTKTTTGIISATIDVILQNPDLSNLSTAGMIDLSKVDVSGVSGLTANNLLYVGKGSSNAVYLNVTAPKAGLYTLRIYGELEKTYVFLTNPAVTGDFTSINRDKDLGATVGTDGYSKYVYYAFLKEGDNQLKLWTDSAEIMLYAARLNYEEAMPAMLACFATNGKSEHTKAKSVIMFRESFKNDNYATYTFTPTTTGTYSFGLFVSGTGAEISLSDDAGLVKLKQQGDATSEFDSAKIDVPGLTAKLPCLMDGSSGSTLYIKTGYYAQLTGGVTYTLTVKAVGNNLTVAGATALNSDASFTLSGFTADQNLPTVNEGNQLPGTNEEVTLPDNSVIDENVTEEELLTGAGTISGEALVTNKNVTTFKHTVTESGLYLFTVTAGADAGKLVLSSSATGNSSVAALSPVASIGTETVLTYTVVQYLTAGENQLVLTAEANAAIAAVEVAPIKKVENNIAFKNFIGGSSIYTDRGYYAEGYYLLRTGDTVLLEQNLVLTEESGIYFINAIIGAGKDTYVSYTFKNMVTNEVVAVVNAKVGETADLSMTAQMLGYVQLNAGIYQISVQQISGAITLLSSTSFTAAKHTCIAHSTVRVEPTCLVDGYEYSTCFCGKMFGEKTPIVAPGSHLWNQEYTVITAPTCTESGEKAIFCARCNEMKEGSLETVSALGHNFDHGNFTIDKAENCIVDGEKSIHCANGCGERTEITVIPATGEHAFGLEIGVYPTDTAAGEAYFRCPICNSIDEDKGVLVLPARPTITESDVYTVTADANKEIKITVAVSGIYRAVYTTTQSSGYTTLQNTDSRYSVHVSQNRIKDGTKYNYVYIEAGEETVLKATELVPARLELVHADTKAAIYEQSVTDLLSKGNTYTYKSAHRLDGGFYFLSTFMYHTNLSADATVTYTLTSDTGESYVFSFKIAEVCVNDGNKQDGMGASATSSNTKFIELGDMVYLAAGKYTVTVSTDNTATQNAFLKFGSLLVTQNLQYPAPAGPDVPVEDGGILK